MPLISTLGAASSRGFGQFSGGAEAKYVEDVFSTYVYSGNGGGNIVTNGASLGSTAEWKTYSIEDPTGSSNPNTIYGSAVDSSGNLYVSGFFRDFGPTNGYMILVKYNSNMEVQWRRKITRSGVDVYGYGIAVDSGGNVYLTGTDSGGVLLKYDSSGVLQWQRKLVQASSVGNLGRVSIDSSDNIYVVGYARDTVPADYMLLAKYNTSGTLQWQRRLYQAGNAYGTGVATDSSGNIYVSGSQFDGTDNYLIVAKYNSAGTIQWQRKLTGSQIAGTAIGVDSSANVYVGGNGVGIAVLAKYNTSGTLQWQRQISTKDPEPFDIVLDSSSNVYVVGDTTASGNTPSGIIVMKYNTSGVVQWIRSIGPNSFAYGRAVSINSSGDLFVSGSTSNSIRQIGVTVKLKQDGSTASGTAVVEMFGGELVEGAGAFTAATGTATAATSAATDSAGTLTDAADTDLVFTTTAQAAVTGKGGLVWIKNRAYALDHALYDTIRGVKLGLASNTNAVQATQAEGLTNFNINGFSLGSLDIVNRFEAGVPNNYNQISWTFIKSEKFFDIVTYTGNGANRTISHNLGSVPGMIIIKRTDTAAAWAVYHRSIPNTEYLVLNTTAGRTVSSAWNSTTPTATVFSLGTSTDVNASGGTYVAYLFAHDAGGFGLDGSQSVIKCDSFTFSTANLAVNLGWEPQFILYKSTSNVTNWNIYDNIRGMPVTTATPATAVVYPNLTNTETLGPTITPTPTGFNVVNLDTQTFVYLAIRRGPMAVPTDATKVFIPTVYTGTNVDNRLVNTTIAPDMVWVRQRNDTVLAGMVVGDRMRGNPYLLTGSTAAEVNDADSLMSPRAAYGDAFTAMNGFGVGKDAVSKLNVNTTANNHIAEAFKRAPGFFDVVAYSGTGSNRTVSHNLGVIPELMLIKQRGSTTAWAVYANALANTEYLVLNTNAARATGATYWNSTTPTSSVFSIGTSTSVNASAGTYVAYLFASAPGVSKVGSYTGTGTTNQINCGFTSGARFVLIKRTDSTGDWYVYDSARGIVAGNDPYILLNSTAAEVTSTDYVDAYSAGFELSSTAPEGLNAAYGQTWTSRTSGFGTNLILGLTFGNGLYVAVGQAGTMTTSTDGVTWTSRTSGFGTTTINSVGYGNGLYVAVGQSGTLTTSSNGTTWTARTSGFGANQIWEVAYGNGLYVAVGGAGTLTTSTDGITWTSQTSGFGTSTINGVAYGNGLFVAVGDSGKLTTSTDGITWTSQTSGFGTTNINGVTYGNGLFVAVGQAGTMATSTDGITWTSRTSGFGTSNIKNAVYGNGLYVAVGDSGKLTTSTDGITWTSRTSGFGTSQIYDVTYGNGLFVTGGGSGTMTTSGVPSYIYLAIA